MSLPHLPFPCSPFQFLAYHLESLGTDGQARLSHSWNVTMTDIQQTYLVPFAASIQAGVSSIMCAYDGQNYSSPVNPNYPTPGGPEPWGIPMCLHPYLQTLLRDQVGFQGYVITDEGAITFSGPGYHGYTASVKDAACAALLAGSDLALGGEFGPNLGQCLSEGKITKGRIAQALTRTLTEHMRLGWFDSLAARARGQADPVPYNTLTVDGNVSTPEHRALSRAAAEESFVLLKNNGGSVLPLSASALAGKKVALIGPTAIYGGTATGSYIGSYSGCEAGPGGDLVSDPRCHVVTLLEALTNFSQANGFTLSFAAGTDVNTVNTSGIPAAVQAAQGAEIILAALGLNTCQESYCSEGEANDRGRGADSVAPTLDLPGSQIPLLQALVAAYPTTPIVLLLLNGGPVSSPYAFNVSSAILECWYPGYEGGAAIVNTLFGSVSPAGRLPVTIVNGMEDLPPPNDFIMATPPGRTHRYFTNTPLYPFGFGLSYATFAYSGLALTPSTLAPTDASFTLSATLTHTGGPVSDEVVLVFGSFQQANSGLTSIPLQQLLGFTRVKAVQPGQSLPVSFEVPRSMLQLVNATGSVTVSPGQWILYLGGGPPSNADYPGGGAVLQTMLTVQ
jgi:beta-glucosidase